MPHAPHPDAPINPITIMLAPELAVLAILEEVVTIVSFTLAATHPRLADAEPGPQPAAVEAANELLDRLDACRIASSLYRRTTLRELLDHCHDDTIPF